MAFKTGTATSPDELRTAISSFAIRTLGNFDDLFGGELGLSSFGGNSVLGLKHRSTGAAYLFDVVDGLDMNNLEEEHVLVGQLLDEAAGSATFDANLYFGKEGDTLLPLDATGTISWSTTLAQTRAGSTDLFDLTVFDAQVPGGDGPFTGAQVGQALVIKGDHVIDSVTYSRHVFEVLAVSNVEGSAGLAHATLAFPAYSQEITSYYLGSYNDNGTNTTAGLVPDGSGVASDLLLSTFSARDPELLADTEFHDFSSAMWGLGSRATDLARGWYARSGRLNFTSGVNYSFYGNSEVGDEYFHMVLQTEGNDKVSHWWMGRLTGDADFLRTGLNATGMFLGTSGPHTDEQGVDTYKYPFSYEASNVAFKNPSTLVAAFSSDGADDTVANQGGGRFGRGPMGTTFHRNDYGENEDRFLYLRAERYAIQAGFNGFQGGSAIGMMGARARTNYPLRPIETDSANGFDEFYISPWSPVEATVYASPMPQYRRTTQTEDPYMIPSEIAAAPSHTGTLATNADGWAEWTPGASADPQITFWGANGADGLSMTMDKDNDKIEFRCRLVSPAVGGTAAANYDAEVYFSTVENPNFGGGNYHAFDHPASFTNGEWTTFRVDPTAAAGWVTGDTLNGFRMDLFRYTVAPTTGAVVEFDYLALGQTEIQRNSLFSSSIGAYAIHLGQFPGVNRITMNLQQTGFDAKDSSVALEAGHFDTFPVIKRGAIGEFQRPLTLNGTSGLAGYTYKR